MPLWECDAPDCRAPAERYLGDCVICDRHLCGSHLVPEFHSCSGLEEKARQDAILDAEEKEVTSLIAKINTRALEQRASKLHLGLPCSIAPLTYDKGTRNSLLGGTNFHFEITFDDGVTWLARVRRQHARAPPAVLRDNSIKNEVATLRYLEDKNITAPKVYDFALENDKDNEVGVGFILMEKLPGTIMNWTTADEAQKKTVMGGLADVYIELQKSTFYLLGSLDRVGTDRVGPLCRPEFVNLVKGETRTIGPFHSVEEYHEASLRHILNMILKGEVYTERPVDAYLIHLFLLDLIPLLVPATGADGAFYLMHGDKLGEHILVDDNLNITGIIDWQHAHTAPAGTVFRSPTAFLSPTEYYAGKNELDDDEESFARVLESKDRKDIAEHVRNGRLHHRFASCCGYNLKDWEGFLGLFRGLRDAANVDEGLDWRAWKAIALERYSDEYGLDRLRLRELSGPGNSL